MAGKNTRRAKKSGELRLFQRVWSPVDHLLQATRNVGKSAFRHSGNIVDNVLGFGKNTGKAVTRGMNRAVNGLVRGKTRRNRNKSRKNRK